MMTAPLLWTVRYRLAFSPPPPLHGCWQEKDVVLAERGRTGRPPRCATVVARPVFLLLLLFCSGSLLLLSSSSSSPPVVADAFPVGTRGHRGHLSWTNAARMETTATTTGTVRTTTRRNFWLGRGTVALALAAEATVTAAAAAAEDAATSAAKSPGEGLVIVNQFPIQQGTDSTDQDSHYYYQPVLDFADRATIDMVDRLDDAIMGGISTSTVLLGGGAAAAESTNKSSSSRTSTNTTYARWVGICRTDGGGFCGFRTNPFREALVVPDTALGLYIECRLVSDNEPDRRVWKFTTRTTSGRGEVLYQAPVTFPKAYHNRPSVTAMNSSANAAQHVDDNHEDEEDGWTLIRVPFASFRLVRGPRMVTGAPPLNTTAGLYQIGMTMSKFTFGGNGTEIENFRPGFFELHIRQIGFYYNDMNSSTTTSLADGGTSSSALDKLRPSGTDSKTSQPVMVPVVMSKQESEQKRSPLVKLILVPMSKLLFSEQSQRRKSAAKILRSRRGMSQLHAIWWFGLKRRAKSSGLLVAASTTLCILAMDSLRASLLAVLKIGLLLPVRAIFAFRQLIASSKTTNTNHENKV